MRTIKKPLPTRRPKARATDVLANTPAPNPDPKWQKYYSRLIEVRNYLVHRKETLTKEAAEEQPAFSMHMADAGTDEFDRDFALSMSSSEQEALYEIDQALNRIQDGAYGVCELTGKPIPSARLDAIPWTRFSAEAEKQLENQGEIGRVRLGRREEVPKTSFAEAEKELNAESKE